MATTQGDARYHARVQARLHLCYFRAQAHDWNRAKCGAPSLARCMHPPTPEGVNQHGLYMRCHATVQAIHINWHVKMPPVVLCQPTAGDLLADGAQRVLRQSQSVISHPSTFDERS